MQYSRGAVQRRAALRCSAVLVSPHAAERTSTPQHPWAKGGFGGAAGVLWSSWMRPRPPGRGPWRDSAEPWGTPSACRGAESQGQARGGILARSSERSAGDWHSFHFPVSNTAGWRSSFSSSAQPAVASSLRTSLPKDTASRPDSARWPSGRPSPLLCSSHHKPTHQLAWGCPPPAARTAMHSLHPSHRANTFTKG